MQKAFPAWVELVSVRVAGFTKLDCLVIIVPEDMRAGI